MKIKAIPHVLAGGPSRHAWAEAPDGTHVPLPLDVSAVPEKEVVVNYWADWLVDAIAGATQDLRFLRGEPEEDRIATEAIFANGSKAISNAIAALAAALGEEREG
jgi:hypothetical protein